MKRILVLGAGRSAPFLIRHLLGQAEGEGFRVTVGDRERSQAAARVGEHPAGEAIAVDAGDIPAVSELAGRFDVVVSLMPPALQPRVARACVEAGRPMVSASYLDDETKRLDGEARQRGVAILTEMGLDPGIDLLSAMELIQRIHDAGGRIESFESYGSGVPAPESAHINPLRYGITWNPRNVVMAGRDGAQFLHGGRVRMIPWHRIFHETWPVEVAGVGVMEAYPNRDSISYRQGLDLAEAQTLIRGTLRYPGWSETWHQIVRLGLPNESFHIADLSSLSWADLVESFLPPSLGGMAGEHPSAASLAERVARLLGLNPTGRVMDNLRWLGLFSDQPVGGSGSSGTAAEALSRLLQDKLRLPEGERDMVILHHILAVRYPEEGDRRERITSTLVEKGEPSGITAMARTVGLPAGIAARLLLRGELEVTGCPHPTDRRIYLPMLRELEAEGIRFSETTEPWSPPG